MIRILNRKDAKAQRDSKEFKVLVFMEPLCAFAPLR